MSWALQIICPNVTLECLASGGLPYWLEQTTKLLSLWFEALNHLNSLMQQFSNKPPTNRDNCLLLYYMLYVGLIL